ncbi:MAG TPA: aminotransferase class IV [Allosphingosinicella sp.]
MTDFDLIETILFDPDEGVVDTERHLGRMKASAAELGFAFDRHAARNELQAATFRLKGRHRIRLLLSRGGHIAIEGGPVSANPDEAQVTLAPLPVASDDFRLRHKTTDRRFYDDARIAGGTFETLFFDSQGFLTEGSFTNLFVKRGSRLLTPPLSRGLLPGILRQRLIEEGRAEEADLRPEDLSGTFYIGNALRGLIPARLV